MTTRFPDEATQAIVPRSPIVDVYQENGVWKIRRPATPTLIGIDGDPDLPLSMNPNDSLINDDDNDGKPGVTVFVKLYGLIEGESYLARREIFQDDLTLYSDGRLQGTVLDDSEQLFFWRVTVYPEYPRQSRSVGGFWPQPGHIGSHLRRHRYVRRTRGKRGFVFPCRAFVLSAWLAVVALADDR